MSPVTTAHAACTLGKPLQAWPSQSGLGKEACFLPRMEDLGGVSPNLPVGGGRGSPCLLSHRTVSGLDGLLHITQCAQGAGTAGQCPALRRRVHVHARHVAGPHRHPGPGLGPAAAPAAPLGCLRGDRSLSSHGPSKSSQPEVTPKVPCGHRQSPGRAASSCSFSLASPREQTT